MGLKDNMSRNVDQNVEEIDLPICRGILANMSTKFFDVTSTRNSSANEDLRFVYLILVKICSKGRNRTVSSDETGRYRGIKFLN